MGDNTHIRSMLLTRDLMATTTDAAPERLARSAGQQPLYSTLAEMLSREIHEGKYPPASTLPSEKELTERYGVSRQTVRFALRMLRDRGLISSHPGIGTIVREPAQEQGRFKALNSAEALLQFVENTEMHAHSIREVIVDAQLGALIECKEGLLLSEATFVRKTPGDDLPMSFVKVYVAPRFAAAQKKPAVSSSPVYQNIEKMFNVRVREIRQDVTAAILDEELASILQTAPGEAALQMTRFYYDANQQLLQVTVSYYPRSRYTQSARFRVADDET
ncbi:MULTISPECIES: GntR family transcriptional regulator [unclassified Caballeronia]|uniref:GntR family transcriptional regulator n=1 Tax=unclassified Caballeronia TaxID=2646786 RepID=UPI0020284538|nr:MULTISPECIES: GntR family transcriptional regulator [unclassified Caballeronia]MDR5765873.1 GntR family transcriptional regulator [Caballeronia sp. LZ028]